MHPQQVHVRQVIRNLLTPSTHEEDFTSLDAYENFLAKALVMEADEAFGFKKIVRKQS